MRQWRLIGLVYALMGVIFTFFAIRQVSDAGWNIWAVLLMALATFDFFMAFRYLTYKK